MRDSSGRFIDGIPDNMRFPVGTVRIRTRHKRGGEKRAFVKVSEPNIWVLRSRFVWEGANGPIPRGFSVHHADGDKLNDSLSNLELASKAEHLAIHKAEFHAAAMTAFADTRRRLRWSTKSATKRTGRHPANCTCPIHRQT